MNDPTEQLRADRQEVAMSDAKQPYIEYRSNNSGGSWWLRDEDWDALEAAGWVVHWQHDEAMPHGDLVHEPSKWALSCHAHSYTDPLVTAPRPTDDGRWLGALATSAAKATDDPEAAIEEWERVTGRSASDEGCNCCGEPHTFTFHDADGNSRYTSVRVTNTELNWS